MNRQRKKICPRCDQKSDSFTPSLRDSTALICLKCLEEEKYYDACVKKSRLLKICLPLRQDYLRKKLSLRQLYIEARFAQRIGTVKPEFPQSVIHMPFPGAAGIDYAVYNALKKIVTPEQLKKFVRDEWDEAPTEQEFVMFSAKWVTFK